MTQPDESRTISSRGKKTKILAGSDETGGAFALVEAVYPPGYVGPPRKFHSDRITALYVVEGEMTIEVDNRVNKAAKGDFSSFPEALPTTTPILEPNLPGCSFSTHLVGLINIC